MKKMILVLALIGLSTALFGMDFYVGANAHYSSAIQPQEVRDARPAGIAPSDFAYGLETRLYLGSLLGGSAVATFVPASDFEPLRIRLMTDVSLGVKIAILRLGIGMGPDFEIAIDGNDTTAARLGGNMRLTGDVVLGDFSLGLSWFSLIDFSRESIADAFQNPYGFLGVSALIRL